MLEYFCVIKTYRVLNNLIKIKKTITRILLYYYENIIIPLRE